MCVIHIDVYAKYYNHRGEQTNVQACKRRPHADSRCFVIVVVCYPYWKIHTHIERETRTHRHTCCHCVMMWP